MYTNLFKSYYQCSKHEDTAYKKYTLSCALATEWSFEHGVTYRAWVWAGGVPATVKGSGTNCKAEKDAGDQLNPHH